mmetsp:Transcript_32695/g.28957  ORF Transcript_32695/g.28957 Transcript_32695/m.28957 type:complete len:214 (+) Transcript_32695:91-732(+)
MVEYLDFTSEESASDEIDDSLIAKHRQLQHQYGMQPTQLQKTNKATDLTELFDMKFYNNKRKIEKFKKCRSHENSRELAETHEIQGSSIVSINSLLKLHGFDLIYTAQDSVRTLYSVLIQLDKLKSEFSNIAPKRKSFESDKENYSKAINSYIEPYNPSNKESNHDLRDQLIALSEKILKKDNLLDNLKQKYESLNHKVKETQDLKTENMKCL